MHVLGAEVWRGDGDAASINVDSKLYAEPVEKSLDGRSSRVTMVTTNATVGHDLKSVVMGRSARVWDHETYVLCHGEVKPDLKVLIFHIQRSPVIARKNKLFSDRQIVQFHCGAGYCQIHVSAEIDA